MRTHVIFRHPAEFLPASEDDGVLSAEAVGWFVQLLTRVHGAQLEGEPRQEDWGVVLFARRDGNHFWIGLSAWPDDEQMWLAHVHHGSAAWLQRFSRSGKAAFRQLTADLHRVLSNDPQVSGIAWFHEHELTKAGANGSLTPDG